jgi:quercetin dioxygenase-like cupin family protein
MKIENVPFQTLDWESVTPVVHPGLKGQARWRTVETGTLRVRIVEYSPGYESDHWCRRGHVVHCLSGELTTELDDGRVFTTRAGQTYQVADNDAAHRSRTQTGATLFIVD